MVTTSAHRVYWVLGLKLVSTQELAFANKFGETSPCVVVQTYSRFHFVALSIQFHVIEYELTTVLIKLVGSADKLTR